MHVFGLAGQDRNPVWLGKGFAIKSLVAIFARYAVGFEAGEIVNFGVGQMRRYDIAQRLHHGLDPTREAAIPVFDHLADDHALQVGLRATQIAWDDRKLFPFGVALDVFFARVGQRADHDMFAVVGNQFGRHGFELAAVEHVQKQRLQNVLAVVT